MVLLPVSLAFGVFGVVAFVVGSSWSSAHVRYERIGAGALMLGCAMAFVAQLVR